MFYLCRAKLTGLFPSPKNKLNAYTTREMWKKEGPLCCTIINRFPLAPLQMYRSFVEKKKNVRLNDS